MWTSRQSSSGSLAEKRCRSLMVGESSTAKCGRPAGPTVTSRPRGGLSKAQIANAKGKGKARSKSRQSKATVSDDNDDGMPELLNVDASNGNKSNDEADGAEFNAVSTHSAMTDGVGNEIDLEHELQDREFFVKLLVCLGLGRLQAL
ncbi:hypothetical protein CPB85DRAFT_1255624 [Mucidula mucida]|nr:hypothetical protein CPB85DRAFT_1255624 [Mucidula mucida]